MRLPKPASNVPPLYVSCTAYDGHHTDTRKEMKRYLKGKGITKNVRSFYMVDHPDLIEKSLTGRLLERLQMKETKKATESVMG